VPPDAATADLVRTPRAYFADNAARTDYPRFVAQQLLIGAGAVDSLCKSLIEARLKQAGICAVPPVAPCAAWPGPLCLRLSPSRGAPQCCALFCSSFACMYNACICARPNLALGHQVEPGMTVRSCAGFRVPGPLSGGRATPPTAKEHATNGSS
jgi:hypothetical protein